MFGKNSWKHTSDFVCLVLNADSVHCIGAFEFAVYVSCHLTALGYAWATPGRVGKTGTPPKPQKERKQRQAATQIVPFGSKFRFSLQERQLSQKFLSLANMFMFNFFGNQRKCLHGWNFFEMVKND